MSKNGNNKYFYGLDDEQINLYIESLGFKHCVSNIAKFLIGYSGKRFLYISSGQFGMKMGKGKKRFFPDKKHWGALREQCELAQVLLIMVGFENCQPWTVVAKKRKFQMPIPSSLPTWFDHSGLIVVERDEKREWKIMRYFDCQFYIGEKISRHFAYDSVTKHLKEKIEEVFLMGKLRISMNKFAQHVG